MIGKTNRDRVNMFHSYRSKEYPREVEEFKIEGEEYQV